MMQFTKPRGENRYAFSSDVCFALVVITNLSPTTNTYCKGTFFFFSQLNFQAKIQLWLIHSLLAFYLFKDKTQSANSSFSPMPTGMVERFFYLTTEGRFTFSPYVKCIVTECSWNVFFFWSRLLNSRIHYPNQVSEQLNGK